MKIIATNDGLRIVVEIKISQKGELPLINDELSRVRTELADSVISSLSRLPFVPMSVARGDIKVAK